MNRVVHFEIGVDDPERAKGFYEKVFDWKFEKWTGPTDYWLIATGERNTIGINGGLYKREKKPQATMNPQEITGYICTIDIENIDETISKIKENGGKIITEKMDIPEVGVMAYAMDTEENIFSIMKSSMEM